MELQKTIKPIIERLNKKFSLKIKSHFDDIIVLENSKIIIQISDKIGDFDFSLKRKADSKQMQISDFIELKYPDYFLPHSKIIIFHLKRKDFTESDAYLQYCIQICFDFLEANFPEAFDGQF